MSVPCTTVIGNLTVCNMLITYGILKIESIISREVGEVRLRRLERNRLKRERETNEERHARFVNCCPCLN